MSGQMSPLDFVFPSEAALIQQDAAGVTGDPELGVLITYVHYNGRTFQPSTGLWTETPIEQTLRAIRNDLSASEIAAGQGFYRAGDVRYLIAKALLTPEPSGNDSIVENGVTFDLVKVDTDPVGAFWRFVMRRSK